MTDIKYFLAKETISDSDIDALCDWLKTRPRLTKGDLTLEFERKWANYIGTKYAVFCNSGSSANHLMIYAAMMCGLSGKKLRNKKIAVPSIRMGYDHFASYAVWFKANYGWIRSKNLWNGP